MTTLPAIGSVITLVIFGNGVRARVHSHTSDNGFTIFGPTTDLMTGVFFPPQIAPEGSNPTIRSDWSEWGADLYPDLPPVPPHTMLDYPDPIIVERIANGRTITLIVKTGPMFTFLSEAVGTDPPMYTCPSASTNFDTFATPDLTRATSEALASRSFPTHPEARRAARVASHLESRREARK